MNKFICLNCNMEFKRKSHLDQHINRKYPCKQNSTQITQSPHKSHTNPAQITQIPHNTNNLNDNNLNDNNLNDNNLNEDLNTNTNVIKETNECEYNDDNSNYECKYCFKKCSRKYVLK